MATKETHPNAKPIILNGKNTEAFLLIHGYTGSPTDFNGLSQFLYEKRNASVYVPLLPGHGTTVEDLRGMTHNDFIVSVEETLKDLLSRYDRVILGGHSFGGQMALLLASRFPVHGVFVTAAPVRIAFPLSFPGLYKIWTTFFKKEFFKKKWSGKEIEARDKAGAFSYKFMPAYGLCLLNDMNKILKREMGKIKVPVLSVYLRGDAIAHSESGEVIRELVSSEVKKNIVFDALEHGAFFSDHAHDIYKEINEFFKK